MVAMPVALLRQAKGLDLDDGDLRLLLALESFRRRADEAVFPSQATLADLCGCSVAQIERRVKKLRQRGLLEVSRRPRKGRRLNHYTRDGLGVALVAAECGPEHGADPAPVRAYLGGNPALAMAPNPSPVRATDPAPVRAELEAGEAEAGEPHANGRGRNLSDQVLAAFNAIAGSHFTADSFRSMIADRVRERPELALSDHEELIAGCMRHPWWHGVPSPAVVYATSAQFERSLHQARNGRNGSKGRASSTSKYANVGRR